MNETNPWRYFRREWRHFFRYEGENYIHRVRSNECGTIYGNNGKILLGEYLPWYLEHDYTEITEAEAAAILGGNPWEKQA